jgi:hypothetical protein
MGESTMSDVGLQAVWLLLLGIPVACASWTVTHEELFADARDWCAAQSRQGKSIATRKFFYLFTCEYCFSHYMAAIAVWMSGYRLMLPDWRGAVFAWLALVWVANLHMSLFVRLRLDIKRERLEVEAKAEDVRTDDRTPRPPS